MPRTQTSVRRSRLALGVALLGVSLASSESATAAAMQFTTLHSATVSLSSLNNSVVSSSATYSGPTTDSGDWTSPVNLSQSGTGSVRFRFNELIGYDRLQSYFSSPSPSGDTFTIRMTWDVTFNSAQGGVTLNMNTLDGFGTLNVTPLGGSAGALAIGDFLANGRYAIQWDFNETIQRNGTDVMLWFAQSSGGGGGGAIPLPGAAGLAACGLLGMSRRRRR